MPSRVPNNLQAKTMSFPLKRPIKEPTPEVVRLVHTFLFSALGAVGLAVPPPRAFLAVAVDIVQVFVLLGAMLVPIMIVAAQTSPDIGVQLRPRDIARITARRSQAWRRLAGALEVYLMAVLALLFAKMLCTWFFLDNWPDLIIDRLAAAIAGALSGYALSRSGRMFEVLGNVSLQQEAAFRIRQNQDSKRET